MLSPRTYLDPTPDTIAWAPERRPVAADPWDMPYFGATVYFCYQPPSSPLTGSRIALRSTVGGEGVAQPLLRFAPWDAPYFGEAEVYFTYPAYPAVLAPLPAPGPSALPSPPLAAIATSAAASAPEERVADSGDIPRRSWLARLFGRN